jgi:hypothetical protein
MYDHDLRLWYRDLFLHSARRRAAAEARAHAARSWVGPLPKAELAPMGPELEVLSDHERATATH